MIFQSCIAFLLITTIVNAAETPKLPERFPLCKNDAQVNECLKNAVAVSLGALKDPGLPEIGVPSFDPLKVTSIEIGQGQGPISINVKFTDITVTGLSSSKVLEVRNVDLNAIIMELYGRAEEVVFVSDYELTGRILLLPVTGKGKCKLAFKNMYAVSGPSGKHIQKKGKDFFNVTDYKLNITSVDNLSVHFENLFNGDKALGESMNALFNENWKDLWSELRPAFEETFGALFLQYSKRIFDKVAFKDIFLDP